MMTRSIVIIGFVCCNAGIEATTQFTDAEIAAAVIFMSRQNECGFVQLKATDIRQCPTYSVTISGDGIVTYEGQLGVRTLGRRTHKVSIAEFRMLLDAFLNADFFSLPDRYFGSDDAIATTLRLSVGGKTKSVSDMQSAPEIIKRLQERVDIVTNSRRYTGRPPSPQMEPPHR